MNKKKKVNKKINKIALVAGGTGGHIFPAISFAKWLKKNNPDIQVIFFSGNRQLEQDIYGSFGEDFVPIVLPINGSPFSGRFRTRIKRSCNLMTSFFAAFRYLREENPDFVLFFGGYISFPVYLAAKLRFIPVALHEQNACAGKVTRLLAKFAEKIFCGFKLCLPLESRQVVYTGVPTRDFNLIAKEDALRELSLPQKLLNDKIVLVLTGSLGSETIRDRLMTLASEGKFHGTDFILPATSEKLKQVGENIWLMPRIWQTELLFSLADVIIARAGASSLAEIGELGIPSIIIPWKDARDNHQYFNAREFVKENNALLLDEDNIERDLESNLIEIMSRERVSKDTTLESASSKIFNEISNIMC